MARWCIGIDLGGTFIKFGLLDESLRPGGTLRLPTPAGEGAAAVLRQMIAGAGQLMSQEKLAARDVAGVGIGAPGPLRISEGVVLAMPNIPGMENVPMRDRVGEALGLPAVLENDANAAAYGEYICGAGKGAGDMVLLTLGTGVGSGIVIDGKVLHGAHEIGAELGHMIVVPDGEECGCGQRGCLERYCSATYIAQRAARLVEKEGRKSSLTRALKEKGAISSKDVEDAHKAGDKLAEEVWDQAACCLALGCVNICRTLDPERIVLAGGMAKAGDELMGPLMKHFRRLHWRLTEPRTTISLSRLGNDAGFIGAAGVAWQAIRK